MALSMRFLASCWLSMMVLPLVGQQHVHLPESRRRATVTHGVDLLRLAFSVEERAELLPVTGARNAVAGAPEVGGLGLVSHAREHAALLAALDLPERVSAELKVIALLIDRVTTLAFDQNAVIYAGDQIAGSDIARAGRQPHIRHALEGHAGPRVRVAAAARLGFADQVRLVANRLVVLENALLDDGELGGQHAVVVVLHGGQATLVGAVAEDIDQLAAHLEFAHLIGGQETGAGEVGFIAERAVEVSGMP